MSAWERFGDLQQWSIRTAKPLWAFAILTAVFAHHIKVPGAVVFALLAMQCHLVHNFAAQLKAMQARIDMKRIAQGEDPE